MKTKILFITSLVLIVGCSKPVEDSTLINKDGLMYLPDSDKPYNGSVFFLKNNYKRLKGKYVNGKKHGEWIITNTDSSVKKIVNFTNGKEDYSNQFIDKYFSNFKYYVTEDCEWWISSSSKVYCEPGTVIGSGITLIKSSDNEMSINLNSYPENDGYRQRFPQEGNEFKIGNKFDANFDEITMISLDKILFKGNIHYNTKYLALLGFNSKQFTTPSSQYSSVSGSSGSVSGSSGCNQSKAKSFAINRINTTIGSTQFLDLHKDNGDSFLFYGSVYSSNYSRDVTVFILIGCSGSSYSVLNVDVQL